MKAVAGTRALILDDRDYPQGTAFKLEPMLDVKHPEGVAQFYQPLVVASEEMSRRATFMVQTLPPAKGPRYTQPTVTLIDDQARPRRPAGAAPARR